MLVGSGLPCGRSSSPGSAHPTCSKCASFRIPSPGTGDIRIRVRAAGINFADILARLGLYPDAPKPPMVVGYEVAGKIDAVGRDVVGFATGDRVVALTRFGGYADTVVVPATQAFTFPMSSATPRPRPFPSTI